MIRVFALDPKYPMDAVVASMEEAKHLIECFQKDHPGIAVYWHPVHKA